MSRIDPQPLPYVASASRPVGASLLARCGALMTPRTRLDVEGRIELGRQRYGCVLASHNGRDSEIDAYQELLDAAFYLEQARMEGKVGAEEDLHSVLWLANRVGSRVGGGS